MFSLFMFHGLFVAEKAYVNLQVIDQETSDFKFKSSPRDLVMKLMPWQTAPAHRLGFEPRTSQL